MSTKGKKDDAGKPMWWLMPWRQLEQVQAVLDYGAKKYGEWNWQNVGHPQERYLSALLRHIVAWNKGETNDKESGLPHLAHAICCALFLMHFTEQDNESLKSF